ncbi:SRPBCC domain-containing protein [Candidatus Chlorohelix sp.]|uniref:CoxG family protein n=1 Tax=Candidatus Chlorohelix sp. TaxID=3139201 RepID=UPI003035D55B
MIVKEEFIIDCPHADAWEFLSNFPSPILVIPGVIKVTETSPLHYLGAVKVHIGPFTFMFTGNMHIILIDHKTCRVDIEGRANDSMTGAYFKANARTQTLPLGENRSKVTLEIEVGLGGLLGKMGWYVLRPKARQVVQTYAKLVHNEIIRRKRAHHVPALQLAAV